MHLVGFISLPIIRIFCISGWLLFPIIPDKWSRTVKFNIVATLLRRKVERKIEYVLVEDQFGFTRAKGKSNVTGKLGIISERNLDRDEGLCMCFIERQKEYDFVNTLRTGDADSRFYITTVQDG